MRVLILFIVFNLLQFDASSQLKKSYFGKYVGTIAGYELGTGGSERIQIGASALEIQISEMELKVTFGTKISTGSWKLVLDTKSYVVIEGKMENTFAPERILIYKKGKKILREGIRPQPDVILKKTKK